MNVLLIGEEILGYKGFSYKIYFEPQKEQRTQKLATKELF